MLVVRKMSAMADPGGLEPPAAGLKVPCPADPGFVRSGSNRHKVLIGAAASRPRLCRVLMLISCEWWLAEPKLAEANARLRPLGSGAAAFTRCASEGWWTRTVTIRGLPVIGRRLCL